MEYTLEQHKKACSKKRKFNLEDAKAHIEFKAKGGWLLRYFKCALADHYHMAVDKEKVEAKRKLEIAQ